MDLYLYLSILFVLSSVTVSIEGQSTETFNACKTPNRLRGICVPIESCEILYQITQKPSLFRSEFNLLRGSQCGNGASWVCCPDEPSSASTRAPTRSTPSATQSTRPTTRSTSITTRSTPHTTRFTPPTTQSTPPTHSTITQDLTTTTRTPNTTSMTSSSATARISITKCNEYKEFAYNKSYTYDPINHGFMLSPISNCAKNIRQTVVGGEEAIYKEFPHMALIGFIPRDEIVWACGGSLISEQFVLSAAHCSDSEFGKARYVRLGEHDLNATLDAQPIDFIIIQIILNPKYRRFHHDIALFKLSGTVTFSDAIRPICLPEQSVVPPKAIATGWGNTSDGTLSNILLKVKLDIFSYTECINVPVFRESTTLIDDQFQMCAGSLKQQPKDTCAGDSGGPLQFDHESHHCTYTVYGVTSFGPMHCGITGQPSVYTRVYSYLSWIEGIVWPNE